MRTRPRRALLLGLVTLLVPCALVSVDGSLAVAEGDGAPVVVSPASSDPQYLGYRGPFVVDLGNAPAVSYQYSVTAVPSGGEPVFQGELPWSGSGESTVSLTTPSALTPGDYTFAITDGAGHLASLDFTVRNKAQPRCSVLVPRAIRVNEPEELVVGRLAADCAAAGVDYASWDVRHLSRGFVNLFVFNAISRDLWKFTASDPLGTYVAAPTAAINPADDDIVQNAPRTTIRLSSRVSLTAERARSRVTLRAALTRYVPRARTFRPWTGRVVTLSYRTCATCSWHRLAARTTNVRGRIAYRVRAPHARSYRATVAGTSAVWAPYADRVRR